MTTLNAFLDLAICPVSFDSVVFLQQAAMERDRIGATRMHVCIVGEIRKKPQYDEAEAEWRLMNIVIPACRLYGATFSLCADWLQAERIASGKDWKNWPPDWREQSLKNRRHLVGGVIERFRRGEKIVRPRASAHARRSMRGLAPFQSGLLVLTMTERNIYTPERNTNESVWCSAEAMLLRDLGKAYILWVRDTADALKYGGGFVELNLDLRMALYEEADFNIVANCGPASLCWFSDKPYLMVGAGVPADEWKGLFVDQGLPLGENWPWAMPHQTIGYGKETVDQMLGAFEAWRKSTAI